MKRMLLMAKPVSVFLTILMLLISFPHHSVFAAMIDTETFLEVNRGQKARSYVNRMMVQTEVGEALSAQGIDPLEAKARLDSLSDAEVIRLAEQIEHLPAGGNALGVLVGASLIVFIVLLITDILGYTNVFPFVS
jgi:hypothetical protein